METINVGNRVSNNYLLKLDKGYLLIDTGYPERFNSNSVWITLSWSYVYGGAEKYASDSRSWPW